MVKLVSITKSLVEEKDLSPEELIVYVARVSNPSNQLNTETAVKLISYLIKHKHWSPLEFVDMTVEITTSRAIAAQIIRHRSFNFQEFSQRYSQTDSYEPVSIRKAGSTNRQSSLEEFDPIVDGVPASELVEVAHVQSFKLYNDLIESGVAKECARMVLPLSTTTTIYMKGSVRSFIHYLQVRLDETTQLEHRQVAEGIKEIFSSHFPNISKAVFGE